MYLKEWAYARIRDQKCEKRREREKGTFGSEKIMQSQGSCIPVAFVVISRIPRMGFPRGLL